MTGSLARIVLGVVLGVSLLMWSCQERLLFFPRSLESRPAPRPGLEHLTLLAADGTQLRGWLVKGHETPAPLVIYFGGNAEEVSWLTGVAGRFAGWSLLLMNYRGYGESEGRPGERELFDDALLIHDHAKLRPDVDPGRIVAMGRSLGSGVAVHLAANRSLRGVVLVSPYDSIAAVGQRHYPFLPVSWMLRHRFDSLALAPKVGAPLLCLVATQDRVIPSEHSRLLFQAWRGAKTWIEVPHSDHDSISSESGYWHSIAEFLKTLR